MDHHTIASHGLTARIKPEGAELCSLITAEGHEMIWQAHDAWPRHAPNLFPIVGTLKDDTYRHLGKTYHMGRHGFARDMPFAWTDRTPISCRLTLTDTAETTAQYPFPFRFELAYSLAANGLTITMTITNTGGTLLPASMGAHPAFNWPLLPGVPKEAHTLTFSTPEPARIRRVRPDGLLRSETFRSPIENQILHLHDGLFEDDAIILDQLASHAVRFQGPGTPIVTVFWKNFPELGIWTRPGVDFLCIEPWQGMSSPLGFDGEFADKPGLLHIPPGESRSAYHRIAVTA